MLSRHRPSSIGFEAVQHVHRLVHPTGLPYTSYDPIASYFQALDAAGGGFIIRGKADITPVIVEAIGPDGQELKSFQGQRLKAISKDFKRYEYRR